jgi:DnaJ-class molecular chaperone
VTSALLESPGRLLARPPEGGRRGRGLTLEEHLSGSWRAVEAHGVAECPVCRGRMALADGSATCDGCGSRLC